MKPSKKEAVPGRLFQFDIVNETTYRSQSRVNITDDMIRVVLDMTRNEWRQLLRFRKLSELSLLGELNAVRDGQKEAQPVLLARGERTIIDEQDIFYMGSCSPKEGGTTECGRLGINHKMQRFGAMSTRCINPGCDACC